ncbi:MAG: pilus assembly protein N-terminal domain-containing protein [Cyanobacteriota bacterium]
MKLSLKLYVWWFIFMQGGEIMVRLKNFKCGRLKLLLFTCIFVLIQFSANCLAEDLYLDQLPEPKQSEDMTVDWISKELKSNSIDINDRIVKPGTKKRVQNNTKNNKYNDPVAYQQIESGPEVDLNLEDVDLTEQDPDFKKIEGGITDIRATVGKSQIVQFAQPIKRMSITDPSLADLILLSPTQMIMNGKAAGVTSLIIWDESDQPAFFDLYVQNDTSDLLDAFRRVAPDEPINIKITDDGNVILSGTVSSTLVRDAIAKICQAYGYTLVDVSESPVPQIVLELRVAEISKSVNKNFAFAYKFAAWADQSIAPDFTFSQRDQNGGIGGEWNGNSENGFILALFNPAARFSSLFAMGQSRGLLNVLAEPRIVTTNGREATFDAGQSIPVPTGVDQNGNLAYEYKDIGVKVTFTPWISEKSERIELKLSPEVSEVDPSVTISQPNGTIIYGFRKRKADTTVELENGETLVIAGLIRRNDNNTYIDPPFLGSIPIIGKFLSNTVFEKNESELVIMVTPKIIKPGVYGDLLGTAE